MQSVSWRVKTWMQFLLVLIFVVGIAGCSTIDLSGNQPLPTVASLPTPQLPDWIERISPIGESEPLAQIRIRFKEFLIPIESLESPDRQSILQNFETYPPLPGQFRFLTPRMVGFQADRALPKAMRVRVTLKAGLADLQNHRLEQDLAWTFNTEVIKLTNLPGNTGNPGSEVPPIDLMPTLRVTSNVELDLDSLKEHVVFVPEGKSRPYHSSDAAGR